MPKVMAATALGAGGTPGPGGATATDPEPDATELEPGGDGTSEPEDSARQPEAGESQPEGGAPEGPETPDSKRLRDTQRALHQATVKNKDLVESLKKLMPGPRPAVEGEPAGDIAPPVRPAAGTPSPFGDPVATKKLADGRVVLDIPLPLTVQHLDEAFQANSDEKLDNRAAFHRAFGGLFARYHEQFIQQVVPQLLRVASRKTVGDLQRHTVQTKRTSEVKRSIESYWKTMAPTIPAKFFWQYADEAFQAHPGKGPEVLGQQALYCLSRGLEDFGGAVAVAPNDSETTRTQDVLLRPGEGGGARPAAGGRGGMKMPTLVDQMRASNAKYRQPT